MEWVLTIITIVAGVVTIIWFIRDVRKENTKMLKAILDVQKTSLEVLKNSQEILKNSQEILVKIEQSVREGLKYLADILVAEGEKTRNLLKDKKE
jgi:uncharacterized membrane-anchored protein YhcB (DUF1043 family)